MTILKAAFLLGAGLAMLAPAHAQQRIAPETWLTDADYPRPDKEHAATLEYTVTPEGRIAKCKAQYATVPQQLVDTTCALLVTRARYVPAYDISGNAVAARDTVSVTWTPAGIRFPGISDFGGALPANSPSNWITDADLPNGLPNTGVLDVPMSFAIGADGRISSCTIPEDFEYRRAGERTCFLLAKRARFVMPRGSQGEPLATRGRTLFHWQSPFRRR